MNISALTERPPSDWEQRLCAALFLAGAGEAPKLVDESRREAVNLLLKALNGLPSRLAREVCFETLQELWGRCE